MVQLNCSLWCFQWILFIKYIVFPMESVSFNRCSSHYQNSIWCAFHPTKAKEKKIIKCLLFGWFSKSVWFFLPFHGLTSFCYCCDCFFCWIPNEILLLTTWEIQELLLKFCNMVLCDHISIGYLFTFPIILRLTNFIVIIIIRCKGEPFAAKAWFITIFFVWPVGFFL